MTSTTERLESYPVTRTMTTIAVISQQPRPEVLDTLLSAGGLRRRFHGVLQSRVFPNQTRSAASDHRLSRHRQGGGLSRSDHVKGGQRDIEHSSPDIFRVVRSANVRRGRARSNC